MPFERNVADVILVDAEAAARLLSVSRSKVLDMARRHQIPSVKMDRLVRFPVRELEAWVQQNLRRGGPE